MNALNHAYMSGKTYQKITASINKKEFPLQLNGCVEGQLCHLTNLLGEEKKYRVIITYSEDRAKELMETYRFFDSSVYYYPAKDILFASADVKGNAIALKRLEILKQMLEGKPATIVTTIDGGLDSLTRLELLKKNVINISIEQELNLDFIAKKLVDLGYDKVSLVEEVGQFSVRGGIFDIYPIGEECPYRIEMWGDEIDTIRSFDVESQRSIEQIDELSIYPAQEIILDDHLISQGIKNIDKEYKKVYEKLRKEFHTEEAARLRQMVEETKEELQIAKSTVGMESFIHYFYEDTVSFFSYFKKEETLFVLDEPVRTMEQARATEIEYGQSMEARLAGGYILPGQGNTLFGVEEIGHILNQLSLVIFSTLSMVSEDVIPKKKIDIKGRAVAGYHNNFSMLAGNLTKWKRDGYGVYLVSPSKTRGRRLVSNLLENEVVANFAEDLNHDFLLGTITVVPGRLSKGFIYENEKIVLVSEGDIFTRRETKKRKKRYSGEKIRSFSEVNVGDYVVHEQYGVGIYRGLEKIETDRVMKDYICIEYNGGSKLYMLVSQMDKMQKYSSKEGKKPKLNKLGGQEWEKTKSKVRGQVAELAKELVSLYATRQAEQGYQYSEDTVWQQEFEEMFPYEETDDQMKAITDTKADMESTKIMDRLICGDVGYGKTEIAIRAAFKAVGDSKQVVYLVPTTILAQQHFNSFTERMKDFPVKVAMLSRFCTKKEQTETLEGLRTGMVDIVIGTHRLLSKDIVYKNLGLLIIDEEQRFGVSHKEKIKQLKNSVDVLTLTATPIPRTLHMSLVGIRDMSILEEPPVDRRAIQTYVLEFNEEIVKEAIKRELARGGQVYYVHNRVNNIEEITEMIKRLVPTARVAFGHGKMHERELEEIMKQFVEGEIDVLVSTTIIETGLDIPNVNTMIIQDADRFGLSQLYQLRGRVGRSNRRAYAFMMYKRDKMIKEVAQKRLEAIREFTDLGSGFKIAMRDLEIRGAGNLLGMSQSGHMEAVGYDLYCKMLNDEILRQKGQHVEDSIETEIDITIDAYIPATYVKNELQKLDLYKRISGIGSEEAYEDMIDEMVDRYGDMPMPVKNLLHIALLKEKAKEAFIVSVIQKGNSISFVMNPNAKVQVERIDEFLKKYRNRMKLKMQTVPTFMLDISGEKKNQLLKCVESVIHGINTLLEK